MNTIIVATDFSPNAYNALKYGAGLAAETKASILLYNAFHIPVHASNARISAMGVDELIRVNKAKLEALAAEIRGSYQVPVSTHTDQEELSEGLQSLVELSEASLVIMGLHANDWSDRLFGNNATAVIREAGYPLLVVPPKAKFEPVKKILYCYDNNRINSPESLNLLSELAARFKAMVQVFHVITSKTGQPAASEKTEILVSAELETALKEVEHEYRDAAFTEVIEGIEKEISNTNANLLVMVPHKLSFWKSLMNQSVTRSMALRTYIPLLILPGLKTTAGADPVGNYQVL